MYTFLFQMREKSGVNEFIYYKVMHTHTCDALIDPIK